MGPKKYDPYNILGSTILRLLVAKFPKNKSLLKNFFHNVTFWKDISEISSHWQRGMET